MLDRFACARLKQAEMEKARTIRVSRIMARDRSKDRFLNARLTIEETQAKRNYVQASLIVTGFIKPEINSSHHSADPSEVGNRLPCMSTQNISHVSSGIVNSCTANSPRTPSTSSDLRILNEDFSSIIHDKTSEENVEPRIIIVGKSFSSIEEWTLVQTDTEHEENDDFVYLAPLVGNIHHSSLGASSFYLSPSGGAALHVI